MDFLFRDELIHMPDLRHRLRQLRWFRMAFRKNAALIAEHYGYQFAIDETRLTRAFLNWVETVEQQKSYARIDRKDFIIFAAGLVLKELIIEAPAKVQSRPAQPVSELTQMQSIIEFWPEGFLYTNYCVGAIAAICEQEFGTAPAIDSCADDLRTWWSYRENVREIPDSAIAFLDKFLGAEPNWIMPNLASARSAVQRALVSPKPGSARLPNG
ncbi:hypothetical protein [Phyllobacterium endophyticum]|jgi:hypothetical protein|uniref:Uncharacterized protein n=1 Tax=Phyllobacterium endophyticum TaxID=1149773 RepID=A0A2P7ANS3_9HYPH|nr:hypothetical protein [Phyllobacterium endophyticum]MBB3233822.1 hypothetical protein [Phyllobacterium endophyticum]PSH55848.1 hypothetical protein CU100_19540 [Phyllobacterium endophyticum]TXR47687.1 hypothetical protein FVA77_18020 [Phyllobacterium endophyticum]TYR43626.1 hypothetical protein FY050_00025 [Phyllobacterium endophyticum]